MARPFFGAGWFRTGSLRGLLSLVTGLAPAVCIAGLAATVWLFLFVDRPVSTADLAFFIFAAGLGWIATCPVCAAAIELRHGERTERRRLFGCCVEAPQQHVFTFDRVTRRGKRVR